MNTKAGKDPKNRHLQTIYCEHCGWSPTEPVSKAISKVNRRIRQSRGKTSKLEERFGAVLIERHGPIVLHAQAITFRLANGVLYTPDFVCFQFPGIQTEVRAWEVKGKHAWDDSIVKLKVAASFYRTIRWKLVWYDVGWNEQEVLP